MGSDYSTHCKFNVESKGAKAIVTKLSGFSWDRAQLMEKVSETPTSTIFESKRPCPGEVVDDLLKSIQSHKNAQGQWKVKLRLKRHSVDEYILRIQLSNLKDADAAEKVAAVPSRVTGSTETRTTKGIAEELLETEPRQEEREEKHRKAASRRSQSPRHRDSNRKKRRHPEPRDEADDAELEIEKVDDDDDLQSDAEFFRQVYANPVNKVMPYLYIGNVDASQDCSILHNLGIRAIVNCTPDVPNSFELQGVTYYRIPVADTPEAQIRPYFENAVQFIQSFRELDRGVLVHCHWGMSRSATIVLAYLVWCGRYPSAQEALTFLRQRRKVVHPNAGFRQQLDEFQASLRRRRN